MFSSCRYHTVQVGAVVIGTLADMLFIENAFPISLSYISPRYGIGPSGRFLRGTFFGYFSSAVNHCSLHFS